MSFITSAGVIVPPLTAGGVAYGTGSQAKVTSAGTVGQVLTSAGAGVPTFTTPSTVTFPITVPQGGTNLTTLTANNVILGNGTAAPTFVAPGTSGNVLTSNGTTWASTAVAASGLTLGTSVTPVSGTSVTFTGIPATAKQIIVNFNELLVIGADVPQLEIGSVSGIETTGYNSAVGQIKASVASTDSSTTFFTLGSDPTTRARSGSITITLFNASTFTYTCSGNTGCSSGTRASFATSGAKSISAILSQIRIVLPSGFSNSGSINIAYF